MRWPFRIRHVSPLGGRIMAYLDHSSAFAMAGAVPVAAPQDVADFTPLEWNVVALASQDRLSSLREPGVVSRMLTGLFGLERQAGLADPRLEALRRFAVNAWHHGYRLPVSETKRFLSAGFSTAQFDTLMAAVSGRRAARRR
jgi:hypothetical protein